MLRSSTKNRGSSIDSVPETILPEQIVQVACGFSRQPCVTYGSRPVTVATVADIT